MPMSEKHVLFDVDAGVAIRFRGQMPQRVDEVMRPLREEYVGVGYWQQLLENARHSGHFKPELKPSLVRPLVIGTLNQTVTWFDISAGSLDKLIEPTTVLLRACPQIMKSAYFLRSTG